MPFWMDGNKRVSMAGRWDDGHTKNATTNAFCTFDEVQKAYDTFPLEQRVIWYETTN